MNAKAIKEGVDEAMGFWLSQHEVTTPDAIVDGMKSAFQAWLDDHTDELIAAIAKEAGKCQP